MRLKGVVGERGRERLGLSRACFKISVTIDNGGIKK